ncbi:MAG: hypothetical protein RL357_1834 [Pseudomonadota bacterium]
MFLQVHQLSVQYPKANAPALAEVSFGLAQGQIGVLIGPSGCGKTSLLRAVAGLEAVASGRIEMGERTVSSSAFMADVASRRVGMVFQDYALFPHMTVRANVVFGLHDWPKAQREARVQEVLSLVELEALAERYPHELSGGQQQRVALARALAPGPDLLLLDEPFSNLDVDLRERLAQELRAILKRAGATALLVTHDQLEAFAMADVIGVMHQGRLHQWGEPYAVYHRPASRFVAEFIGDGVFVPGHYLREGNGWCLETPIGRLDLGPAAGTDADPTPGQACEVLLRADDIVHDDDAPVKAKITRKAFRGAEFLYTLQLDTGHKVLSLVPSHHNHAIGEHIGILAHVDHVVAFDRAPLTPVS